MDKGITIAGTIVVDYVKIVDSYPEKGMLTVITDVGKCVGGCVPNTAIDLAKLDSSIPISTYGIIGNDDNGKYVIDTLKEHGIGIKGIKIHSKINTSFSDVMTESGGGERTFFYYKQANAALTYEDLKIQQLETDILHIGYISQLDALLQPDSQYINVVAKILAKAREKGIITCIDLSSDKDVMAFQQAVRPCIPYCDYVVVNEMEAGMLCNISTRDKNGKLLFDKVAEAAQKIIQLGINKAVIIHAPEGGFYIPATVEDRPCFEPSLTLPKGYIKGTVGAGDAFCAGILYGIYKNHGPKDSLKFAAACAAANLSAKNSVDGIQSYKEVMKLLEKYPQKNFGIR